MDIRPFSIEYLEAAAALLAARQGRDRERDDLLPERFEDPSQTRPLIERLTQEADGVVAFDRGEVVGYMLGSTQATGGGRTVSVPPTGYAVDARANGLEIYREMYASLSETWIERGYFDHYASFVARDDLAREAWFSLSFGADMIMAIRDTSSVGPSEAEVDVRRASPDDLGIVHELRASIFRYNSRSPLYRPYVAATAAESLAWEEHEWARVASEEVGYFIAYDGDAPIGIMLFTPAEPSNAIVSPQRCVHLQIAYLRPEARMEGVGTAVLDKCLEWARAQGYEYCTLRYFTANLLGARFWQAKGFRPFTYRVARHIDERIAWARAPE